MLNCSTSLPGKKLWYLLSVTMTVLSYNSSESQLQFLGCLNLCTALETMKEVIAGLSSCIWQCKHRGSEDSCLPSKSASSPGSAVLLQSIIMSFWQISQLLPSPAATFNFCEFAPGTKKATRAQIRVESNTTALSSPSVQLFYFFTCSICRPQFSEDTSSEQNRAQMVSYPTSFCATDGIADIYSISWWKRVDMSQFQE